MHIAKLVKRLQSVNQLQSYLNSGFDAKTAVFSTSEQRFQIGTIFVHDNEDNIGLEKAISVSFGETIYIFNFF